MTKKQFRPKRPKKLDRLTCPDVSASENACHYAIAPFDRAATEMEKKWGIDRLPELVSPEMAAKYGMALGQMNEAAANRDPQLTAHKAAICIRGLHAMDAEATAAGHRPATGAYTEYELDGWKMAVLHDQREWQSAKEARPDLTFFTMREVALAMRSWCQALPIEKVKHHFPAATVKNLPDGEKLPASFWATGGDFIPF